MAIESTNPATGETLARFEELTDAQLDAKLDGARAGFERWRATSVEERVARLRALAGVLRRDGAEYARLMALEMGKPLAEGEAEVRKCIATCEFYAEWGPRFVAEHDVSGARVRSVVGYRPLGVVLAVMPWNYPFWQVLRVLPPAWIAGNVVALKHASNVPQCALAIEQAVGRAGFPDGALSTLLVGGGRVRGLIEDERIAAVTVTGSSAVGAAVASAAGASVKPHVLELGGSDAFVVLDDADVEAAVAGALRGRFQNAGQSCVAAKRFLVADALYDDFAARLAEGVAALRVGDPLERETRIGPLARPEAVDELAGQVDRSVALGARVLAGGTRPDGPGWFYPPTVLADVTPAMPVFREETFGPVAPLVRVRDDEEAVALANDSQFGLGASVWSRDAARAQALARRLEVGIACVNQPVASDPALPFGGVRQSGYGRELGPLGVHAFTNVQAIAVAPAAEAGA